jgi:hypothetical protein
LTVLFVGSLQEGKGVVEIFKTASLLKQQGREQDFRFRIVGKWFSQEFESDIRHLRAELELEEMVELAGQLTGDEKWRTYAGASVFFFPTHYASEATPIVLMEALGAGLPLLTNQWAGIPAMLEGCETAWLLPVRSPDRYATALAELHARRHELGEMRDASRAFYQKNFLPERFIERVGNAFVAAAGAASWIPQSSPSATTIETCGGGVSPSLDTQADLETPTVTDRRYSSDASSDLRPSTFRPPDSPSPHADGDKWAAHGGARPTDLRPSTFRPSDSSPIHLTAYLADQNPGHDRSFGISRMSQVVLEALQAGGGGGNSDDRLQDLAAGARRGRLRPHPALGDAAEVDAVFNRSPAPAGSPARLAAGRLLFPERLPAAFQPVLQAVGGDDPRHHHPV